MFPTSTGFWPSLAGWIWWRGRSQTSIKVLRTCLIERSLHQFLQPFETWKVAGSVSYREQSVASRGIILVLRGGREKASDLEGGWRKDAEVGRVKQNTV